MNSPFPTDGPLDATKMHLRNGFPMPPDPNPAHMPFTAGATQWTQQDHELLDRVIQQQAHIDELTRQNVALRMNPIWAPEQHQYSYPLPQQSAFIGQSFYPSNGFPFQAENAPLNAMHPEQHLGLDPLAQRLSYVRQIPQPPPPGLIARPEHILPHAARYEQQQYPPPHYHSSLSETSHPGPPGLATRPEQPLPPTANSERQQFHQPPQRSNYGREVPHHPPRLAAQPEHVPPHAAHRRPNNWDSLILDARHMERRAYLERTLSLSPRGTSSTYALLPLRNFSRSSNALFDPLPDPPSQFDSQPNICAPRPHRRLSSMPTFPFREPSDTVFFPESPERMVQSPIEDDGSPPYFPRTPLSTPQPFSPAPQVGVHPIISRYERLIQVLDDSRMALPDAQVSARRQSSSPVALRSVTNSRRHPLREVTDISVAPVEPQSPVWKLCSSPIPLPDADSGCVTLGQAVDSFVGAIEPRDSMREANVYFGTKSAAPMRGSWTPFYLTAPASPTGPVPEATDNIASEGLHSNATHGEWRRVSREITGQAALDIPGGPSLEPASGSREVSVQTCPVADLSKSEVSEGKGEGTIADVLPRFAMEHPVSIKPIGYRQRSRRGTSSNRSSVILDAYTVRRALGGREKKERSASNRIPHGGPEFNSLRMVRHGKAGPSSKRKPPPALVPHRLQPRAGESGRFETVDLSPQQPTAIPGRRFSTKVVTSQTLQRFPSDDVLSVMASTPPNRQSSKTQSSIETTISIAYFREPGAGGRIRGTFEASVRPQAVQEHASSTDSSLELNRIRSLGNKKLTAIVRNCLIDMNELTEFLISEEIYRQLDILQDNFQSLSDVVAQAMQAGNQAEESLQDGLTFAEFSWYSARHQGLVASFVRNIDKLKGFINGGWLRPPRLDRLPTILRTLGAYEEKFKSLVKKFDVSADKLRRKRLEAELSEARRKAQEDIEAEHTRRATFKASQERQRIERQLLREEIRRSAAEWYD